MSEAKLVNDWLRLKEGIKEREAKLEQLKTIAEKMMKRNGSDIVMGEDYKISKTVSKVSSVSKSDLPKDIVDKYSKTSERVVYRISRI